MQFPLSFLPKDLGLRAAIFADAGSLYDYNGPTVFPGVAGWDAANSIVDCTKSGYATKNAAGICVADDNKVRSSVGASLIWNSPFGPLRFDYAWALSKANYDDIQEFRFSGGTRF